MRTVSINGVDVELTNAAASALLGPAPVIGVGPAIVFPADLWRRATDDEAEAIMGAMDAQPLRIRKIFERASTFRDDDELWPMLEGAATQLFGAARAAELLAPSA